MPVWPLPGRTGAALTLLAVLLAAFAVTVRGAVAAGSSGNPVSVTDIKGRTVLLPAAARRLAIDDSRVLLALSLIDPDPVSLLAAWPADIKRIGPETYRQFRDKFPAIAGVARIASSQDAFQAEAVLAAAPDVALFTAGRGGPSDTQIQDLQAAGVAVVFVDFISQPFQNLSPSLRLLGRVIGRELEAEAFVAFRDRQLDLIAARLRDAPAEPWPTVFLETHAGLSAECCSSSGRNDIGAYVRFAGGRNIGDDVLPGSAGRLNPEYVLERDPEVYIATGGPHLERAGGLVLGPGFSTTRARGALARMAGRPGISLLGAVRQGRVHGIAHQLLHSPLDLIAVTAFAHWLHPRLFAELDPQRTLDAFNTRFLPFVLEGTYWVDLADSAAADGTTPSAITCAKPCEQGSTRPRTP
ncbi:MAG: ABC transporter substrate-binding protein [Azospirillum sp.]|nr:ABC transporter substrate-binding protein [Azospirillum sp.]